MYQVLQDKIISNGGSGYGWGANPVEHMSRDPSAAVETPFPNYTRCDVAYFTVQPQPPCCTELPRKGESKAAQAYLPLFLAFPQFSHTQIKQAASPKIPGTIREQPRENAYCDLLHTEKLSPGAPLVLLLSPEPEERLNGSGDLVSLGLQCEGFYRLLLHPVTRHLQIPERFTPTPTLSADFALMLN